MPLAAASLTVRREGDIHQNTMCHRRCEEQFLSSCSAAATGLGWWGGINSLAITIRGCLFLPRSPSKKDNVRAARQTKWQKNSLEGQEIVDNFYRSNVFVSSGTHEMQV